MLSYILNFWMLLFGTPLVKDLYIEVDWMKGHKPSCFGRFTSHPNWASAIAITLFTASAVWFTVAILCLAGVITSPLALVFLLLGLIALVLAIVILAATAKEVNLVGTFAKHDINLHIDRGGMGGGNSITMTDDVKYIDNTENSNLKTTYFNNQNPERVGVFHWCLFAYKNDPSDEPGYGSTEDWGESDAKDSLIVFDGAADYPGGTFMHELGHTLGLNRDYLGDTVSCDDYPSVMNYNCVWNGFIGYSDGTHGSKDHNDWGELDFTYFNT